MDKKAILKRAKAAAAVDEKNRRDARYIKTMGFLTAKGFLRTNQAIPPMPNAYLDVDDAIWAGQRVEPRILEVLPAAVLRLDKHFNFDPERHVELKEAMDLLKTGMTGTFLGIPIEKIKPWLNLRLKDRRTKKLSEKKVPKTFRFSPDTIERLNKLKTELGKTETSILEDFIKGFEIK